MGCEPISAAAVAARGRGEKEKHWSKHRNTQTHTDRHRHTHRLTDKHRHRAPGGIYGEWGDSVNNHAPDLKVFFYNDSLVMHRYRH